MGSECYQRNTQQNLHYRSTNVRGGSADGMLQCPKKHVELRNDGMGCKIWGRQRGTL